MAAPLTCVSTQREKLANELPACRQAARRWRSVYPDVGMAKVRLRRYKASEQLADGIDPAVAKREEKQGCVLIPWERNPHQFFRKNGLEELSHKNLKTTMSNFKFTQCCES